MDRLTVGARFYNNGGPPQVDGYLRGEIAEILIYDRRLSGAELVTVDDYLVAKYGAHRTRPIPLDLIAARPIPKVEDAPPVQMLVPGFTARQLPLTLPNINVVRYRPDGKVMALSYDGHLHLLSDTDGDGLEDKAEPFWTEPGITAPIGMALTPPGYARGAGGVHRRARAGRAGGRYRMATIAGIELVKVADGWEPIKPVTDTLGVAIGPDGSVYYGTGTQDFTNGFQLDAEGKAHYVPGTERGAIVKVSPDFKTREPICSGIRFTVSLAFNREGDLFCTEQEGATWLPNGNPFDELLHIRDRPALRLSAAASQASAQRARRAQRVRLHPAASKHLRHDVQRAPRQRREDVRAGLVAGQCDRVRVLARQALSHDAHEDSARLRGRQRR